MITIVLRVLSIFFLVGLGFCLDKKDVLSSNMIKPLTNFIFLITTPCINFYSIAQAVYSTDRIIPMVEVSIGIILYFIVAICLSFVIVKVIKYKPKQDAGIVMVMMVAVNCGFMGFPVTQSVFGDEYLFFMVIINALSCFYTFLGLLIQFNYGSEDKGSFSAKALLKDVFNPPLIAVFLGFIFYFGRISVPDIAMDLITMIGDITVPLSMIVIGIQLGEAKIKKLLTDKSMLFACFIKLVAFPFITFVITYNLPISQFAKVSLTLATCFPTAAITATMATRYKKNYTLMSEGIALTTLFSVVTVSIWCMILTTLYF